MQLTVPHRTAADTQSFPVEPEGVSRWLSKLNPTQSLHDAMEVYRGLRHSNRLHNELNRRRAIIACFIPTLRELQTSLQEICQAQPLPLTTELQRSAQLLDGLLREEAFAFKILLADSTQPRGDDIWRAMQALVSQAESRIYCYRNISESLLIDANQLYELAEEYSLLDANPDDENRNTAECYRYILLLTLADCRQHRARQLGPLLEFLQSNVGAVRIRNTPPSESARTVNFALHLRHGARPVPAGSLVVDSYKHVRWFDLAHILTRIDAWLAKSRTDEMALQGAGSLDRQSFARLRVTFALSRHRRSNRAIKHESQTIKLGHTAICAHLNANAAKAAELYSSNAYDADDLDSIEPNEGLSSAFDAMNQSGKPTMTPELKAHQNWSMLNQSAQGAAFYNPDCRSGIVQVGDLVSMETTDYAVSHKNTGKSDALLGVVRWIIAGEASSIRIGVEYIAKGILPIGISRSNSEDNVIDDAMIVSCKIKDSVIQTILLPAFIYQPGDQLTVTLGGKSRNVKLKEALLNNGLFSHFTLSDN